MAQKGIVKKLRAVKGVEVNIYFLLSKEQSKNYTQY